MVSYNLTRWSKSLSNSKGQGDVWLIENVSSVLLHKENTNLKWSGKLGHTFATKKIQVQNSTTLPWIPAKKITLELKKKNKWKVRNHNELHLE